MARHRTCDGMTRRDLVKLGVLGPLALNLSGYLRVASAGQVIGKAKSAIFVELNGGPTHMDTFDLKPDAPAEYRGEFKPVDTNVPGVQISEHLPLLAKCADKYTILRGVSHSVAAHALGQKYMTSGNRPIPALEYPGIGNVVSKELPSDPNLPSFVAVPKSQMNSGYLGVRYASMETGGTPRAGQSYTVRGITVSGGKTIADVERRQGLLNDLDKAFRGFEKKSDLISGLDQFDRQVYNMTTSNQAREAFDTGLENPEVAKRFGTSPVGMSCMLAARLIGAGVRFVTVQTGGWDTHQNNFASLKDRLLPPLDMALSGLLTTLAERGQLESTAVIVTGEFGRTPKVNQRGGRDHWPRAMFVLMAGGGFAGGKVIGASNEKGEGPAAEAITPEMVASSIYQALGIDYSKEYHTNTGRPIMVVREGHVIPGLFA